MASYLMEVKTILDLPSGHGRVLRHLIKMFPEARCDVCDLDVGGMDFALSSLAPARFPPAPISRKPRLIENTI